MPHEIGFVDNTSMLAHYAMLVAIRDFCEDAGWTILRHSTATENHELIMSAPGYVGPEGPVPAYVGFQTYQNVDADYYNILAAGMTGYVGGNPFNAQPGFMSSGIPSHNQRIDYWLTVNDRRLALSLKVGTPVYEACYLGFALPYATPLQFPYPLIVGGMLGGASATRYSDTSGGHTMPYVGAVTNLRLRFLDGTYLTPYAWPWGNQTIYGNNANLRQVRPTGTSYSLLPVVLHNNANAVYGELDGIYAITGFDNVVENTLSIGGVDYVVFQNVHRTGFIDYYALRLDPNGE